MVSVTLRMVILGSVLAGCSFSYSSPGGSDWRASLDREMAEVYGSADAGHDVARVFFNWGAFEWTVFAPARGAAWGYSIWEPLREGRTFREDGYPAFLIDPEGAVWAHDDPPLVQGLELVISRDGRPRPVRHFEEHRGEWRSYGRIVEGTPAGQFTLVRD